MLNNEIFYPPPSHVIHVICHGKMMPIDKFTDMG